ncbi:PREDICTED: uncharacterized protein LOC106750354 isoform X2 [Dinoponera quadriceps]|uniref:Uncharacterized protein LOC106750354 isoform X2 n=1 Tax=Dinoponera quadriceps TaxID=609295 RepID=A0A6P3Y5K6_DINQU|nr:PREDICTED: uncharacterized protein LOC106750354 isoform X2 [Dinoponera quadriceps]
MHRNTCTRDASIKHSTKVGAISQQTLAFLKENIHMRSGIVCWIVNKLISAVPNALCNVADDLRDIYFSTLKLCLKHAPLGKIWHSGHDALEFCSSGNGPSNQDDHLRTLLCVLLQMDVDANAGVEFFKTIYPMLLKTRNVKDIELALYSRRNGKLFSEWLSFWDETHVCSESVATLDTAYKIGGNIFKLTENSEVLLCKQELLKRISTRRSHWLSDILDICYVLTVNRKYSEVELLLSCDTMKRLYPILLLKALNECPHEEISSLEHCDSGIVTCESIKFLLEKCYPDLHDDYDLNGFYVLLKKHVSIVEYILHWKRRYFARTRLGGAKELRNAQSDAIEETVSVKRILALLQKHSVLAVLRMTTNIHEQDHDAVQDLLITSPESENFQAYCSIVSALRAVLLCESYNTEYEQIAECFADVTAYLSTLFPLSLRLETMRNIFSLVFLRYEDFNATNANPRDDDCGASLERTNNNNNKSVEYERSGFVSNKYAMRDILHYLWESTTVATREIDKLQTIGGHEVEAQRLREGMSAFASALVDARWRLKFHAKSDFIGSSSVDTPQSRRSPATSKAEPAIAPKLNLPHRVEGNAFFYKEESTSDETKLKSDSGSESGLLAGGARRRKRSRNVVPTDPSTAKDRPSLINLMLASQKSLLLHCLWRSDLQKAQEVIEMFHMENTRLNSEVRFAEALHAFKLDTLGYVRTSDATDSPREGPKSSILENIRLAAQEGVQSSRYTNQLETLLASQKPHLQKLNADTRNGNETLTLSVLDLSLTIGQTHQISCNLCDVAVKYVKLGESFDNTEYASFFLRISQLFYESKSGAPMTAILCDARIPLSTKEWRECNAFWSDFESNCRAFRDTERAKTEDAVQARSRDNRLRGLKMIKRMSAVNNNDQKYLQNIYSHLQLVYTIIPDANDDTNLQTVTDLLRTPLHHYFGYQLFELQTEPDKLETVASSLQVNLIYSILVNVCPNISCYNERSHTGIEDPGRCVVLNQNRVISDTKNVITMKGPNQCVSEILTELLRVLHLVTSGQPRLENSRLRSVSDHTDVRAVLSKTSSLATLDLGELSVGDETLTFFLNVWNVMFLHACLTVWCDDDPPFDHLRHAVSLMSVGYVIGDLGLVTLASLRSRLLGNWPNDLGFFTRIEELNELAWQDLDLVQNPRVVFAMANEFNGTPEIRVYETRTLNESLDDAMRDYLSHYSNSLGDDSTRRQISLPDLVRQYQTTTSHCGNVTCASVNRRPLPADYGWFETLEDADVTYVGPTYVYEVILRYPERDAPSVGTSPGVSPAVTSPWQSQRLKPSLLQYLEGHCWLLSYLLHRMQDNEKPTILETQGARRTACLENLLNSSWVARLQPLFDRNRILAAVYGAGAQPARELWSYFEGDDGDWENALEVLNALADHRAARRDADLLRLKDLILCHVLSDARRTLPAARVLRHLYQIRDVRILAQTVLHNVDKWPMNVCEHALFHTLQHRRSGELPAHCRHRMKSVLGRITIFHKMIPYCVSKSNSTWYDVVYCTEKVDPFQIMRSLINADQFGLCLEWLECQAFALEIQPSVMQDFLIGLLKNQLRDLEQARKFLQTLPSSQSVKVCKGVLKKLESTSALKFVVNYLSEHCRATEKPKYRKILVGVDILKMLESKERALYIHLIKEPLLMLEQLLMNCKFESIQKILNTLNENLQHLDVGIGNFDRVIRLYAKKSLDFRVSFHRDGVENKGSKTVPQSDLRMENDGEFVMPVNVPTKEEWVPNDKARECSCCKAVIFSMFNRRHHCRRCGRVVCAVCSQHRMQVAGYPASVSVRVCDDCKRQTVLQMRAAQDTPSTPSSEVFDYWRLTKDEKHNRTIREEFSFEHAPNISLCLAILNLHTDHKMYTSFLLDCCDEMKQLLLPVGGGRVNPEVDHAVIIKMIRSLLVAAKVRCAKLGFNTGLAHCDRFLSQVDLIATLLQSDCLALVPKDELNEHTLRKLRDLLTEKEQWTLALDVSTKAGLDTQGVWAAWGKACLKVGHFEQAKDKFYYCLDKIARDDDLDGWVVLTYSKEPAGETTVEMTATVPRTSEKDERTSEAGHSRRNEFAKLCRPLKDPPLLTEILQILETLSVYRYTRAQCPPSPSSRSSDAAQEILQTLNSLKAVSQNQLNQAKYLTAANQTIYYHECLYYLLMYGSHASILRFFLKHREYDRCLAYVLENDLEREHFLNGVYLHCLRNGGTGDLHEAMRTKDPTLLAWKTYLLHVCHFMEKRQHWHILYQLQLFMRDCVRASMTCIRFYVDEANAYSDLHGKAHLLRDAQRHLESELRIDGLNRRRRSSVYSQQQGVLAMEMEPSEIDRHINTICRQTEIAKFLAGCEREERTAAEFLSLFPDVVENTENTQARQLPTLFGDQQQKIHLAVLAILCGRDIEEGFGIAFRIMQDYNLPQQKVYSLAGHVLALKNNVVAIEQLIKCCRSSGAPNAHVISDHVLTHCVKLLLNRSYSTQDQKSTLKNHIDTLVRLIIDTELRINAYIESKQLKAAYLLAVKHSRAQDIRRILKESDRLGQNAIKAICLKWLQQDPKN